MPDHRVGEVDQPGQLPVASGVGEPHVIPVDVRQQEHRREGLIVPGPRLRQEAIQLVCEAWAQAVLPGPLTWIVSYPLNMLRYGLQSRPLGALFLTLLGLAGVIYALISWLFFTTISGWTSVIIAVFVLGGVQLISLGIFGEYIGRLYLESKHRPLFIVDEVVNGSETRKIE